MERVYEFTVYVVWVDVDEGKTTIQNYIYMYTYIKV